MLYHSFILNGSLFGCSAVYIYVTHIQYTTYIIICTSIVYGETPVYGVLKKRKIKKKSRQQQRLEILHESGHKKG